MPPRFGRKRLKPLRQSVDVDCVNQLFVSCHPAPSPKHSGNQNKKPRPSKDEASCRPRGTTSVVPAQRTYCPEPLLTRYRWLAVPPYALADQGSGGPLQGDFPRGPGTGFHHPGSLLPSRRGTTPHRSVQSNIRVERNMPSQNRSTQHSPRKASRLQSTRYRDSCT